MEEGKPAQAPDKKWWQEHQGHNEEAMKHWRSWGSWYSWGSAMGFSIFLVSIGVFIWLLHQAGLIGR